MTEEQAHIARLLNANPSNISKYDMVLIDDLLAIRRERGEDEFQRELAYLLQSFSPPADAKLITYLEGENAVLIEKLRQVERELARVTAQRNAYQVAVEEEREACAKVADDYATYFINNADGQTKSKAITAQTRAGAAKSIATLIRGRGEK